METKQQIDISRRRGKVLIDYRILETMNFSALSKLFCRFFPFAIDNTFSHFQRGSMYYGYCDLFDEIEEGTLIPQYVIEFTETQEGVYLIEAKKIDEPQNV